MNCKRCTTSQVLESRPLISSAPERAESQKKFGVCAVLISNLWFTYQTVSFNAKAGWNPWTDCLHIQRFVAARNQKDWGWSKVGGSKSDLLRLFGLSDGFQMPKNIFLYFSFKERWIQNLTQVVSYFFEHLWITYEFPNNSAIGTYLWS